MKSINSARKKQVIVLKVNMDSPSSIQVNAGKIRNPALEPINLAAQTESKLSLTALQAYQKAILVGTPNKREAAIGLSSHHLDKN